MKKSIALFFFFISLCTVAVFDFTDAIAFCICTISLVINCSVLASHAKIERDLNEFIKDKERIVREGKNGKSQQ